jgi:hypothetical protein
MTLMQFAIGALNDLVDAPRDAGLTPGQPIPAGMVEPGLVRAVVVGRFLRRLRLSALSDRRCWPWPSPAARPGLPTTSGFKGTPYWVPFALGIPLCPPTPGSARPDAAASRRVPAARGRRRIGDRDRERPRRRRPDRAARTLTPAVVLGPRRAWRALVAPSRHRRDRPGRLAILGAGGPGSRGRLASCRLIGVGLGRDGSAAVRERGWELQALGIATLAAGWLLAIANGGG